MSLSLAGTGAGARHSMHGRTDRLPILTDCPIDRLTGWLALTPTQSILCILCIPSLTFLPSPDIPQYHLTL